MADRVDIADGICLLRGAARDVLQTLAADSFDSIVTDPPYGLSKEPDAAEVLRHWLAGDDYAATGGGFMGKTWDSFVPGPATWREVLRVLKPGGHALVFAGTRTHGLMEMSLRLAGFEIRDCLDDNGWRFDALSWCYGSGFPKSLDISKAIDKAAGAKREVVGRKAVTRILDEETIKRDNYAVGVQARGGLIDVTAPATDAVRTWEGWGTALKPAHEPIIVARKPMGKLTVAANALRYGTGVMNIDACRVATAAGDDVEQHGRSAESDANNPIFTGYGSAEKGQTPGQALGRWPANVLLTHHPDCERVGTRIVQSNGHHPAVRPAGSQVSGPSGHAGQAGLVERHAGGETVTTWACVPGCPVAALDAQSGATGAAAPASSPRGIGGSEHGIYNPRQEGFRADGADSPFYADTGGASRFYSTFAWSPDDFAPFLYVAKPARSEREAGLTASVMLCSCETTRQAWADEDRRASTPAGTATSPPRGITASTTKDVSEWPMTSSGSDTTGPSPTVSRSTTETRTSRTIESRTSNSSMTPSTSGDIPGASFETACGGSPAPSAESGSPSTMSTGISPARDGRATDDAGAATSERSSLPSRRDVRTCPLCGKWDRQPHASDAVDREEGSAGMSSPRAGAGRTAKNGVWNVHCTVKPIAIMRWLVRLVTPPGGLVLDPFAGSFTTGCACVYEGFRFTGIDLDGGDEPAGYIAIGEARIRHALSVRDENASSASVPSAPSATPAPPAPSATPAQPIEVAAPEPPRPAPVPLPDFLARLRAL